MPAVYSIPPDLGFADTLADGLLAETGGDPLPLARYLILLPNRRAARALREAFLRRSGEKPMLLPRMRTVDEADEDELAFGGLDIPPAIPALERTLLLAKLVAAKDPKGTSPDQAVRLATELAGLLDSLQIERIDPSRLHDLAPDDLARHWQETLTFLDILLENWPSLLAARGQIDPQERINRILDAQAQAWTASPPSTPIIAAGSTGTRPATAALLKVVMSLPNGRVILPGLDLDLEPNAWDKIDEVHPQYGMKRLLDRLEVSRAQVRPFAPSPERRAKFLSEIMRPAAATHVWRSMPKLAASSVTGLTRLDLPTPRDEAGIIALILRDALETPGRTAALVTPDRGLAARVRSELMRWSLFIDDSAGTPAAMTPPGAFLSVLARAAMDGLPPHELLSLLKHPLATADLDDTAYGRALRRLEMKILRGPRPAPGLDGLRQAAGDDPILTSFLDQLAYCIGPLLDAFRRPSIPLRDMAVLHLECAESLASTLQIPGMLRVWAGEAGEILAQFASDLAAAAPALGDIDPSHYPALFDQLIAGLVVRPKWGAHPRLFLWGPIEARLQRADVMILAGLNEGTWPPQPQPDPWMSRPMRKNLGLPLEERRIGLSAHDFCQGLAAPTVYLTRSERVEGTPTTPARWLLRMDTVLRASGLTLPGDAPPWLHWYRLLDKPDEAGGAPSPRPAPKPPLAARPRDLSVTQVETWMRDPYAVYARHILKLKALDPIDADPGAAEYGQLVHQALERFLAAHPGILPPDAEDLLLAEGRRVFADTLDRPGVWAFWWPRFESVARWVVQQERKRRPLIRNSWYEIDGELTLAAPGGAFRLRARADRLDALKDGTLALIDYKTGTPPGKTEIAAGYAPQLPLEAAIAAQGGFKDAPGQPVSQMLFWQLKGGTDGGREIPAGDDSARLAHEALAGLGALVAAFDDPDTAYQARPYPAMAPKYSDYGHLARIAEWSSGEDDGGGE